MSLKQNKKLSIDNPGNPSASINSVISIPYQSSEYHINETEDDESIFPLSFFEFIKHTNVFDVCIDYISDLTSDTSLYVQLENNFIKIVKNIFITFYTSPCLRQSNLLSKVKLKESCPQELCDVFMNIPDLNSKSIVQLKKTPSGEDGNETSTEIVMQEEIIIAPPVASLINKTIPSEDLAVIADLETFQPDVHSKLNEIYTTPRTKSKTPLLLTPELIKRYVEAKMTNMKYYDEFMSRIQREKMYPAFNMQLNLQKIKQLYFQAVPPRYSLAYLLRTNRGIKHNIIHTILQMSYKDFCNYTNIYNGELFYKHPSIVKDYYRYTFVERKVWPVNLYMPVDKFFIYLHLKGVYTNHMNMQYISPKFLNWRELFFCTNFKECVQFDYHKRTRSKIPEGLMEKCCEDYYKRCWLNDTWIWKTPIWKIDKINEEKYEQMESHASNTDIVVYNGNNTKDIIEAMNFDSDQAEIRQPSCRDVELQMTDVHSNNTYTNHDPSILDNGLEMMFEIVKKIQTVSTAPHNSNQFLLNKGLRTFSKMDCIEKLKVALAIATEIFASEKETVLFTKSTESKNDDIANIQRRKLISYSININKKRKAKEDSCRFEKYPEHNYTNLKINPYSLFGMVTLHNIVAEYVKSRMVQNVLQCEIPKKAVVSDTVIGCTKANTVLTTDIIAKSQSTMACCIILELHHFEKLSVAHIEQYEIPSVAIDQPYAFAKVQIDYKTKLSSDSLYLLLRYAMPDLANDIKFILRILGEYHYSKFFGKNIIYDNTDNRIRLLNYFIASLPYFSHCSFKTSPAVGVICESAALQEKNILKRRPYRPLQGGLKPTVLKSIEEKLEFQTK